MRDRPEMLLRVACLTLAALLLFQIGRRAFDPDPLANLRVPALPVLAAAGGKTTNAAAMTEPGKAATNLAVAAAGTNTTTTEPSTNSVGSIEVGSKGTGKSRSSPAAGPGASPRSGMAPLADLPPAIRARVDRIAESEMLGQVVRPLPMALLGIAGEVAFLRAPSGQTGMVKEGADLGGLKLVRIGTNRVLVEQDGEKKELTIFNGLGGESLMPKQ